jgi:predicted DCC family thiol-disulfide oxidoreductase YuxK
MNVLYVLYDGECGLCARCRDWLREQPAWIELRMIPFQSEEVAQRFEGLDLHALGEEIHVIADDGSLYRGDAAWLMCLYALKEYRELSYRLNTPTLRPMARRFCEWVSEHRIGVSDFLQRMGLGVEGGVV